MSFSATPAPTHADAKTDVVVANFTTVGRFFFALAVTASGIQQLVIADFVRLVPKLPAWIPWQPFWAYAVGVLLVLTGVEILIGKRTQAASIVLGSIIFLCFLCRHLPIALTNPLVGYVWTNPFKVLALCGGTGILATIVSAKTTDGSLRIFQAAGKWYLTGRVLFAVFLVVCGVQHFVYVDFVVTLVPAYIPGHTFWAYFTGVALILGGAGLLFPKTARLAALSSGVMILLWVVMLHIPRALADRHNAGETSAIFEALALSGVAFLVAGTVGQKVDRASRPNTP